MIKSNWLILAGILLLTLSGTAADMGFDRYHSPAELNQALADFAAAHPQFTMLHKLAVSPGGNPVHLLEIGPETGKGDRTFPAVMVVANMEGTVPISSEGALYLAKLILEKPDVRKDLTWYILPCGNPDAASRYFDKPLYADVRNAKPHNDDMDDQIDEDGVEDLNNDGYITTMRVKDPQGEWIPLPGEPRLMKKADSSKGERGEYKLYSEGIDNDKDGLYNEDGPGGVNIGINFAHLFKSHTPTGGAWSGSEDESFHLIKFIMEHREIGLTFCFGDTNFCLLPPQGGRQGSVDMDKIKIPERFGGMLGIDTEKTYTMKEIMEMLQPMAPAGMEITESMIASFLGLGAVVNPLPEDLKFYTELSEKFKEFLKAGKLDAERLDSARAKDGSFELWSYYHLGLPSFSMDFWTLPEVKEEKKEDEITPEKLEQMSDEEFIALGEEKIDAFLKSVGAPPNFKGKQVIEMVKSGKVTTKQMAKMMKQMPKPPSKEGGDPKDKALVAFSDRELDGKAILPWKPFDHPTLGQVEIGGNVPFADNTPPADKLETLLKGQVPWVFEIARKMAHIQIAKTEVKARGGGIYQVKVWVENAGYLPYPTAMGKRNTRILPVVVSLEGDGFKIIEGKRRSLVQEIPGHKAQVVTWLLQADKAGPLTIKASTRIAWGDTATVDLGGSR